MLPQADNPTQRSPAGNSGDRPEGAAETVHFCSRETLRRG